MGTERSRLNLSPLKSKAEPDSIKRLEMMLVSTMSAFIKSGQIDRGLLLYIPLAVETVYSLFPYDEIAFQIVLDAALIVRRTANERENYRRYNRSSKKTKVLSSRAQLFQQLIQCESQKWEKYQETNYLIEFLNSCSREKAGEFKKAHNLGLEDLKGRIESSEIEHDAHLANLALILDSANLEEGDITARYLEYLVQNSLDNNSAHVALVICHFVYDYPLPRVTDICAFLNPESIGGQYLYTLRSKLMQKIADRFGPFIDQGKEKNDISEQVLSWAQLLTPWETKCLPDKSRSDYDEHFYNWIENAKGEDQKEMSRAHLIICPECYSRFVSEFKTKRNSKGEAERLPPPKSAIPRFRMLREGGGYNMPKRDSRSSLKDLRTVEMIEPALVSASSHMKELLVFVDGERRGRIALSKKESLRLELNGDARFVKVMSQDDSRLLLQAALLLRPREIEGSPLYGLLGWKKYSIKLDTGEKISFKVSLSKEENVANNLIVEIDCKPGLFKRLSSIDIKATLLNPLSLPLPKMAFGILLLSICLFGLLFYYLFKDERQMITVDQKKTTDNQARKENLPDQEKKDTPKQVKEDKAPDRVVKVKPDRYADEDLTDKEMSASQSKNLDLSEVEKIYVDPLGDDPLAQELRNKIMEDLPRGSFTIAEKRSSADAVIKGTIKERRGKQFFEFRLINQEGTLLIKREFVIDADPLKTASGLTDYLISKKR
jgi:hypothetical protein